MNSEPIFCTLPTEVLSQASEYLKWDPLVSTSPAKLLSECDVRQRLAWLDTHRMELEKDISWVGTPIFSYALGNPKAYAQIVVDVAAQLGATVRPGAGTAEIEAKLIEKLWSDALSRMTDREREALLAKVEAIAAKRGPSAKKEMAGFAGLAAAQMSGFGVYLMGSTLLGALNSALGLGLGFGAFTGLSGAISVLIGPVGWAALGLYTIKRLGGPNYKKLLPVVILVAAARAAATDDTIATHAQEAQVASEKLMRLRVTCRCGHGSVEEFSATTADVLFQCSKCGQRYTFSHGSLLRLDGTGRAEKVIEKAVPKSTPGPEVARTKPREGESAIAEPQSSHMPERLIRRYSKAEKLAFNLRPENRALCEIAAEFYPGEHFLDLAEKDQQVIRDLKPLRDQTLPDQALIAEQKEIDARKQQRKQRQHEDAAARALKKQRQKTQHSTLRRTKDYARLLRNLEFTPDASERLELLEKSGAVSQIEEKLGLMNAGQVIYRDSISGTHPTVYEAKAGYDYRIYYYRNGGKICVCLIGDKGSQDADLARLRRSARNQTIYS